MRPHELWEGQGAKERAVRTLVTPLSWLYALGWQAYLASYKLGIKRSAEPHKPIVCVGSLLVGGSGKSPLTHHIAELIRRMGRSVVIGCSGYGAPHSANAAIAPDGPLQASVWGDEPAMFRWFLPEVPLVVGRDRVLAAKLVHENFPSAVLLMDDGFQHLPLKKHLTILIDDPNAKNSRCLPAGPNREPKWNRRRADIVLPGELQVARQAMRIVTPDGRSAVPIEYAVLCALGQADRFISALKAKYPNAIPNAPLILLPDHDPLTATDLWHGIPRPLPIVVTAKDWVKLRDRADVGEREFLIALQEVTLEPRDAFLTRIERSINE